MDGHDAQKIYRTIMNATGELITGAHEKTAAASVENFEIGADASKLDDTATVMLATLGAERLRLTANLHAAAETIILRAAAILTAASGDGVRRLGGIDNAADDISKAYRELQIIEGAIDKIAATETK